jgi:hypothetical protein
MGRDRREVIQAPWWLQARSRYGDSCTAGTGVIMAGTAVIALPHGDISSITTGIDIFTGSTAKAGGGIRRCVRARLRLRRRVCA